MMDDTRECEKKMNPRYFGMNNWKMKLPKTELEKLFEEQILGVKDWEFYFVIVRFDIPIGLPRGDVE